jgi:hypothetical protein
VRSARKFFFCSFLKRKILFFLNFFLFEKKSKAEKSKKRATKEKKFFKQLAFKIHKNLFLKITE